MQLCGFTYCDRLAWNAERERCVIGDYGRRVTNADSGADSDTFSDGNVYTYCDRHSHSYIYSDSNTNVDSNTNSDTAAFADSNSNANPSCALCRVGNVWCYGYSLHP